MGRKYCISIRNTAGESTQNQDKTMVAAFTADTAGHRFRVREIGAGNSDVAPADLNIGVALKISTNATAGTADASPTPEPLDSDSLASIVSGGADYSVEPTVYGDPVFALELHTQASFIKEWAPEDAPICNRNELAGVVVAARAAATAPDLTVYMIIEEF